MNESDFWNDKEKAQRVISQLNICKAMLIPFQILEEQLDELKVHKELLEEAYEDEVERFSGEATTLCQNVETELKKLELVSFLGGHFDKNNAIITLHAGSGGTESCDWAQMLFRMYTRWMERKQFDRQILDIQEGENAGIKSATLLVKGLYAYGYLQAERGVHRLVRISPFDSNKRRHTSFAALEVSPDIEEDIDIKINERELRIDTFRSSGAGGQHVNTTDSAVRITHLATKIVVSCQSERSQHQNRATAMRILRSKLYERQSAELDHTRDREIGCKEINAWGSQIRSYVLHPYQMVKDLRTDVETGNTNAVFDGDLEPFIEAWLKTKKPQVNNERQQ